MGRIKPIEGQQSLLPGVMPVQYCRACGRLLTSEASRDPGLGPTCAKREEQGLVPVLYCGLCSEVLEFSDCACDSCGMGYELFPVRVRRKWVVPADAGG